MLVTMTDRGPDSAGLALYAPGRAGREVRDHALAWQRSSDQRDAAVLEAGPGPPAVHHPLGRRLDPHGRSLPAQVVLPAARAPGHGAGRRVAILDP